MILKYENAERPPFDMAQVTIMDPRAAYDFVLSQVGCSFPRRDAVDARIVNFVKTGKPFFVKDARPFVAPYVKRRLPADSFKQGIITDPQQVSGLPEYSGQPVADNDADGMPDIWERANGLNPSDPSDALGDCNGDGYTNIEKYINGIDTKTRTDWKDLRNNHDTMAGKKSLM